MIAGQCSSAFGKIVGAARVYLVG